MALYLVSIPQPAPVMSFLDSQDRELRGYRTRPASPGWRWS